MKRILTLVLCLASSSLIACSALIVDGRNSPSKTIVKYENQNITSLDVSSTFQVFISQGNSSSATVEVPQNILPYLEFNLRSNGELVVRLDSKHNEQFRANKGQLKLHVTTPELHSIRLTGAASAFVKTPLKLQTLQVDLSGASQFETWKEVKMQMELTINGTGASVIIAKESLKSKTININLSGVSQFETSSAIEVQETLEISGSGSSRLHLPSITAYDIKLDISGVSHIEAAGRASDLNITGSGSSKIRLGGLVANRIECFLSGVTQAWLNSDESISGRASGASCIIYTGTGSVDVNTSGSSSVSKR